MVIVLNHQLFEIWKNCPHNKRKILTGLIPVSSPWRLFHVGNEKQYLEFLLKF